MKRQGGSAPVGTAAKFGAELDALLRPALQAPPGAPPNKEVGDRPALQGDADADTFIANGVIVVQGDDGSYFAEDAMQKDGTIFTLRECINAYLPPCEKSTEPRPYQVMPFKNTVTGELFAIASQDDGTNKFIPVFHITANDDEEETPCGTEASDG